MSRQVNSDKTLLRRALLLSLLVPSAATAAPTNEAKAPETLALRIELLRQAHTEQLNAIRQRSAEKQSRTRSAQWSNWSNFWRNF